MKPTFIYEKTWQQNMSQTYLVHIPKWIYKWSNYQKQTVNHTIDNILHFNLQAI